MENASEEYSLHSEFDVEKHKQNFTNYLEVVIDEDGNIMYAVPSNQEKMIALACEKLSVSREELNGMCPEEYYFDFITWISKVSGVCAVWNEFANGFTFSKNQISALIALKKHGLYLGEIPK